MNFELGEEQVQAINNIQSFINSDLLSYSLTGFAGTGKTTIISEIIQYLFKHNIRFQLCAPTHKAALVIQQATNYPAITLHKLLALSPKLDILQLDFNDLGFNSGSTPEFPQNGIIICDEASMINDDLYDFLNNKCKEYKSKVLYVGDAQQLQPVKQLTFSKALNSPNKSVLTKIYRQSDDSALVPILSELRKHFLTNFTSQVKQKSSIFVTDNMKEFSTNFIENFRKATKNSDILYTKILAYTNDRVQLYNKVVHKLLFECEDEYHKLEFLTCYDNIEWNGFKFWNSMDYIITLPPDKIDIHIPYVGTLPGYKIELYDSLTKISKEISLLNKDIPKDYMDNLTSQIELRRINAVKCKDRSKRGKLWGMYFSIINSFCTPVDLYFDNRLIRKKSFDYGYALSCHKSQGSTLDNVFIDMRDIYKQRNAEELRQLQYVSLSRTKHNAYIYV